MDAVTSTIVNIRNRPISGTSSDVGGISFDINSKKTVRANSTDIHKDIFSPEKKRYFILKTYAY